MTPVIEGEACENCGLTGGNYTPAEHHLPPGTLLIGRYMVGRVLGEGGFGITYIGCDIRLELKVAIKEYFPTDKAIRYSRISYEVSNYNGTAKNDYEAGKEKFLKEARTMARMDKQAEIVGVRDFFDANNTAYIVMEYVEGTTFNTLVKQKGGRIPPDEFFGLLKPLFPALNNMHKLGLIHRDISPDNLMLEKGTVRLLDFGSVRESFYGSGTLTIMVKHGYAPIEQYQHKGQGPWTDVYALSATIYYCLTGKVPEQAVDRLYEDELIPPRKLGVNITEKQEQAILFGMGIRPKRRFQSVEELYAALYGEEDASVFAHESENAAEFKAKETEPENRNNLQSAADSAEEDKKKSKKQRARIIAVCSALAVIALVVIFVIKWFGEEDSDGVMYIELDSEYPGWWEAGTPIPKDALLSFGGDVQVKLSITVLKNVEKNSAIKVMYDDWTAVDIAAEKEPAGYSGDDAGVYFMDTADKSFYFTISRETIEGLTEKGLCFGVVNVIVNSAELSYYSEEDYNNRTVSIILDKTYPGWCKTGEFIPKGELMAFNGDVSVTVTLAVFKNDQGHNDLKIISESLEEVHVTDETEGLPDRGEKEGFYSFKTADRSFSFTIPREEIEKLTDKGLGFEVVNIMVTSAELRRAE